MPFWKLHWLLLDARERIPSPYLAELITELSVKPLNFDHAQSLVAIDAFLEFGKGRHREGLNFGDCMIYAAANVLKEPLLFTGDDFAHTDIISA